MPTGLPDPYHGAQARACWSKANACLSAGYQPSWNCEDYFKDLWDESDHQKNQVVSGGYVDTCGAPLKAGEPTSTYQARKVELSGS